MSATTHDRRETAEASAPPAQVALRSVALSALARCAEAAKAGADPGLAFLSSQPRLEAGAAERALRGGAPVADDLALRQLGGALDLCDAELLTLALLLAADQEPLVAQAITALQGPARGSHPTLGLLSVALGEHAAGRSVVERLVGGRALAAGVLELDEASVALPERRVSLPLPVFLALRGLDGPCPGVALGADEDAASVVLGPTLEASLVQHALSLAGEQRVLCIRSSSPAEGHAAAAALARTLGRRAAFVGLDAAPRGLGALLLLRGLVPVVALRLGPGERARAPRIAGYAGPLLVLLGLDGAVESAHGSVPDLALPLPSVEERALLWTLSLGDAELARELSARHRHGPGRIAHLGRLARHYAALEDAARVEARHVEAAAWVVEGGGLGSLAQAVHERVPDEGFVASARVRRELEQLVLRCRLREGLPDRLGPTLRGRTRPGVRALFVGPSGTGKTLAASWVAGQLGVPLYRIDLSAVTSKYIGETEKNLAEVLARAERADVALLFDEADSLFGRRTEVRDSTDRFANSQTNYLLVRIESYDGIVLLTSNSRARFDAAFSRRLDSIVDFALPGPEERRALWRSHLGAAHTLSPEELNRLAATAGLAGGHIRNAVLSAAVLAAAGTRAIGWDDVLDGLAAEYDKLGQSLPTELRAQPAMRR